MSSALQAAKRIRAAPDFTMPAQLTEIGESAFEGLSEMKVVDAHSCATIGKDAFKGTGLARIRLGIDCDIDAEAFGNRKIYVFAVFPVTPLRIHSCRGSRNTAPHCSRGRRRWSRARNRRRQIPL